MSLISEALKEAQRSHSQRATLKNQAPVGETFFPYPEGRKPARSSNKTFLIGGIVVAILAVGAATIARVRGSRPSAIAAPVSHAPLVAAAPVSEPVAAPVAPPVAPPTSTPATAVPVTAAPARLAGSAASGTPKPSQPPVAAAVKTPSTAAQPAPLPATDSAAARAIAARVPPSLPTTPAPGASAAGVHVVIDGGSARSGDSLFKQAYTEQARGNFDRSKELYEKAIALPQASAETFNNYGVLLLQNGNQLGASEMFKQAIARDDKNVDAWVNLGDSYNAIGHHAEAMGAFARAAQLDASNAPVKIRLATEYQAIGDTATARRMYEDAAKLAPKDPSVHYNFGKFLQAQRDFRGAIREYQAFVDLAPGKFSAENIAVIRQYIVTLGRYVR